ncbi:unnamed protein product [Danaus chrysippus]|uniref:(African queen) hypothetical protein n=1 Tax=Danaus chrysippus TaxID=151541 RepID=A0A8J2QLE0_9NEOP|nr:unnamed protein product [Danaus chrysippus]
MFVSERLENAVREGVVLKVYNKGTKFSYKDPGGLQNKKPSPGGGARVWPNVSELMLQNRLGVTEATHLLCPV